MAVAQPVLPFGYGSRYKLQNIANGGGNAAMQHPMFWWALAFALSVTLAGAGEGDDHAERPVRLVAVHAPLFSGLMDDLIGDFRAQGGSAVHMTASGAVYDIAREGEADIIISHCGHGALEHFVNEGYGRWPRSVFANQMVIVGPADDPAKIRGLSNAVEAFRRIATAKASFVANNLPAVTAVGDYLWEAAGRPDKTGWFVDGDQARVRAIKMAEEQGGYVIWGASPFLQYAQKHGTTLEILVSEDSIFQRTMCAVVVEPSKVSGANAEGASAFLNYLISPRAQARVARYRQPQSADLQLWWPAAQHNDAHDMK